MVRYLDLADRMREAFRGGLWRDGQALPSEADLCALHGVSRTTVRAALDVLEAEGLVRRQQGSGTFFRDDGIRKHLGSLVDFNTEAEAAGHRPRTSVLSLIRRPAGLHEIAAFGAQLAADGILELRRLRFLDDRPALLQTSYLARALAGPIADSDLEHASLYRLLAARRGIEGADIEETLEPAAIGEEDARALDIEPGTAVFRSYRIARAAGGRIVEVSDNLIRGDIYRCTVRRSARDGF